MRFYPGTDIDNYWEIPPAWPHDCCNPHKSWKRRNPQEEHTIAYWRDIEGAKKPLITKKDFHYKDWPYERKRRGAYLPCCNCAGNRFILLEKTFPADFKCTELPMNLKQVRELKKYENRLAKSQQAEETKAKKLAQEKEKLGRKKNKTKGKKRRN